MKKVIAILCILSLFRNGYAQNLDSLWNVFNDKAQSDTSRLKAIHAISWSYNANDPDTAIILASKQLKLAKETNQKKYEGRALNTLGVCYLNKSDFTKALDHHFKALDIRLSINDKQGIGFSYNNIGNVYKFQSDFTKALDYYLRALKIKEEINDKKGIGSGLTNIGTVYFELADYDKAVDYQFKAISILQELNNLKGVGYCYNNLGIAYGAKLDHENSLEYFLKAKTIWEEIDDKDELGTAYYNIGNLYLNDNESQKSLEYFSKALKLRTEVEDQQGIGYCYNSISTVYNQLRSSALASKNAEQALAIALKIEDRDLERLSYENLAISYANVGNYRDAYSNYIKFKSLTDTIFNIENSKQLSDLKTTFEVEKKESELNLKSEAEQDKLKTLAKEEKKIQYLIIVSVTGILLIVLVFSIFLYKRFTITKRQKRIIEIKSKETEIQKHLVEEKQREIIDSITYAKRLQQAILPPQDFVNSYLPNNFLLYKPKDIIAGDFYWMHVSDDSKEKLESSDSILPSASSRLFIAAADSTGHGVPGAMVSIVCSNALEKAVKEFGLLDTGKILDKTTDLVLETFARSGEEIKDGMDISLLCIDKEQRKVFWSGAHNHLLYISNNELKEIKADKQPVGKNDHREPFKTNEIRYVEGTIFYLMTDGYPDQFGGPKGKKFKYKQLESLILENFDNPLNDQLETLVDAFDKWKGGLEQVDDVTIIGIKI